MTHIYFEKNFWKNYYLPEPKVVIMRNVNQETLRGKIVTKREKRERLCRSSQKNSCFEVNFFCLKKRLIMILKHLGVIKKGV